MILDTIKSVAGTAGTAGVVWICVHYLVQLLMAIAAPVCWVIGVVMTVRYASTFFGTRAQTASADEIEKTKQKQIDLEKAKVEATEEDCQRSERELLRVQRNLSVLRVQQDHRESESDMNRQQHRKLVRERVSAENKKLARLYGIPKSFIGHARQHGKVAVDIVQSHVKHGEWKALGVGA